MNRALFRCFCLVVAATSAFADWLWQMPPNVVLVDSHRRNQVFYAGEPITLRLSNAAAAVTYEIRDYWGNLVEQGPAAQFIFPQVRQPGWYKVYLRGAQNQEPWGEFVGGSMFVIFRNDPNFPSIPAPGTWGGDGLDDGVMRGIAAIGPNRHKVIANDPAGTISYLSRALAVDKQYYKPFDSIRTRKLMAAFADGTSNLAGVEQIVTAFEDDIKYWECRNEANFDPVAGGGQLTNPADFVNNELKPFYQKIKSIDPSLKVLGPAVVTIGPNMQGWVEGFFQAGGANYIDGFSFHAYNNVNGDLTLTRKSMEYLDDLLVRYNATHLERWQTEQGYMAAVLGPYQPRLQARWTMLQMMVFEQHGIPKENNHLWYDKNGGFWSEPRWLENEDGTLNPTVALMRVWSEELFGKAFVRALDFGNPGNKLYVGSIYEGSGKKVAALLSAGSTDGSVELAVSGDATVKVISCFGVERTVIVQNGRVTLPITELPTYVEFTGTLDVTPINRGQNFARLPGTTAVPSGTGLHPNYPSLPNDISKIFNGQLENWYWTQYDQDHEWMDNTPQFPAWVELRFPSPQTIDNVVVYSGVPWQWDGSLLDYDLQYDNNGQWVTLDTVNEPTKTFKAYTPTNRTSVDSFYSDRWVFQHSFAPVTTHKIRLYVRDTTWGGGATQQVANAGGQTGAHQINLREIEVYWSGNTAHTNQPPALSNLSVQTQRGQPVDIDVLAHSGDPDQGPQPLQLQSISATANGTVAIVGNVVRYIPNAGFAGNDSFTCTVSDGLATATANISVIVQSGASSYSTFGGLTGVQGQYFATTNLTNLVAVLPETTINHGYNTGWPLPPVNASLFSTRWTGKVQPKYSENYTFSTLSDDGVRLWVNGQLLVDNWTDHSGTEDSWVIPLQAGQQYDFVMEYYNSSGGALAQLMWSSPSQPKEIVPRLPSPLFGGLVGLKGEYYGYANLTNLKFVRYDPAIDFNWGDGAPGPGIGADNFSVRWTGQLQPQYSETYTIYSWSDDGVRVWIDGNLLIDNWTDHGPTSNSATLQLQAGRRYNLKMEYYENTGGAEAGLLWSSPSQPIEKIRQVPEDAWRMAHFSTAQLNDTGVSGEAADPDRDGIPNRLEYAFHLDPLVSDSTGAPTTSVLSEAGRNYLALIYRRNNAVTDLAYDVQVSNSLQAGDWQTIPAVEEIIGTDAATGDLIIRRRVEMTGEARKFIRLKLW